MVVGRIPKDEGAAKARKPSAKKEPERRLEHPQGEVSRVLNLQRQVDNRMVQRLLAQRCDDGLFELDAVTGAGAGLQVQHQADSGTVSRSPVRRAQSRAGFQPAIRE